MKSKVFNCSVMFLFLLLLSFPSGHPVQATGSEVFSVNTFADVADFAEGNGVCSIGAMTGGLCSLRAALQEADELVGYMDVQIFVPEGTYTLSLPKGSTPEDNHSGDLDIDGLTIDSPYEITITGTGTQPSVIDANGIDRVLQIGAFHEVTLQNLVITGGLLTGTEPDLLGGGIKTDIGSEVTLYRVNVIDNQIECPSSTPTCSMGGGIYTENSDLLMSHSRVSNNRSYSASAIYAWDGTGIPPQHMTNILNSLFDEHSNTIFSVIQTFTNLRLINTTMTNNTGSDSSGNILALGPLWVQNSTLVYPYYGTNIIVQNSDGYNACIRNSLLVSYTHESGWGRGNCSVSAGAAITSEGGNVFTDKSCNPGATLYDRVIKDGEVVSSLVDALLGPLQDNGGYVLTMKPLLSSPAYDRRPSPCVINVPEDPAYALTFDARDHTRNDGKCDAGAVEERVYRGYLPAILR